MQLRLLALIALPLPLTWLNAEGCGSEDPPEDCPRATAPADYTRKVVVSHPYDATGGQAKVYEVLELSTSGTLTRTGQTFQMGRATDSEIVFTPDGQVGIVSQDDGTLGVFRFDETGKPVVVHAAFRGDFYADGVVMDPSGLRAWVLDPNWRENGGGIYSVHIQCDGTLTDEGMAAPSKLAYGMAFLPGSASEALVAAKDVLDSAPGDDAHLVDLTDPVAWLGGADAFGDDDAIVSALTVTFDGRYGLIGDNNLFSGTGNRVAVVDLEAMTGAQVLKAIEDPVDLVASPFDNAVLVVSGFGDALLALSYSAGAATPFTLRGGLTYSGGRPQLPGQAVLVSRGGLEGLVLVAETSGVRRVRFEPSGAITDLGLYNLGSGYTAIPGALGVQP